MSDVRDICGLSRVERYNLDAEMATLVRGIEKKDGLLTGYLHARWPPKTSVCAPAWASVRNLHGGIMGSPTRSTK
jgi:hypothetical protein